MLNSLVGEVDRDDLLFTQPFLFFFFFRVATSSLFLYL